jgi:hypothetical protein
MFCANNYLNKSRLISRCEHEPLDWIFKTVSAKYAIRVPVNLRITSSRPGLLTYGNSSPLASETDAWPS